MLNRLFGDKFRVKQIFNNLLSNAFKHTQKKYMGWYISTETSGNNIDFPHIYKIQISVSEKRICPNLSIT
jgi:signal transduction histidine kinase